MDDLEVTSVPTNLTFEEVMSQAKPGQKLNQDQFSILANAAMQEAAKKTKGRNGSKVRFSEFSSTLLEYCTEFGDTIDERFVLVAHPRSHGHNFSAVGRRLYFNSGYDKSPDGYRYLAAVY